MADEDGMLLAFVKVMDAVETLIALSLDANGEMGNDGEYVAVTVDAWNRMIDTLQGVVSDLSPVDSMMVLLVKEKLKRGTLSVGAMVGRHD